MIKTFKFLRNRFSQLARTSRIIIREQGISSLIKQAFRWLLGERGYYRQLVEKSSSTYEQHWRATEPSSEALSSQAKVSANGLPSLRFDIITIWPVENDYGPTARSLDQQSYPHWNWYIVSKSVNEKAVRHLKRLARSDPRITLVQSYEAIAKHLTGDYVVMLDAGDTLAAHALYTIATAVQANPQAEFIYSDVDELDKTGQRCCPFFKPDWSPEAMLSVNLLFPLGICRRDVWQALQPFTDYWDFALRVSEQAQHIHHIPQVLYHQQPANKTTTNAEAAITAHLERKGLIHPVVTRDAQNLLAVQWKLSHEYRISIIIPTRDQFVLIENCLSSLFRLTNYQNFQVIVVDTGSTDPSVLDLYKTYNQNAHFKLVHYEGPFNFSRACNLGAAQADGELLLFLNNDAEVLQSNWLTLMAQWFDLEGVGVVGAKLLYPSRKVQHGGVILGLSGLADNLFANADEHISTVFGSVDWYRNFLAVTGACLMIKREIFGQVSGFDEDYRLVFSDVGLCVQVHEAGYRIVYTPQVQLIHHEAATHNYDIPVEDILLGSQRLHSWLRSGDPYFNANLSYLNRIPSFRQGKEDNPYDVHQKALSAHRAEINADL